ncbi:MAG: arginyltransferase [Methylophilaceae bacterium]
MSSPKELPHQKLRFYVTTPYQCGYLPSKLAQSLIAAPHQLINAEVYSGLIQQGFRRSGKFAYRPHCALCNECVPVRVILDQFSPTRSQVRAYKKHANLSARILPLSYSQSHFDLYVNYQNLRHGTDEHLNKNNALDDAEQYRQFLCQSNVESLMIEFRDSHRQVKIVSVVDIVKDGISAVYTFYDANDQKASYGTYSIMWLIEWTKSLGLSCLYLGYWIRDSQKMAYKQQFKPQEKLIDGKWVL